MAFSPSVREFVVKANDFSLETVVGCPVELFHRIGVVLEAGKAYLAHEVPVEAFEEILEDAEDQLRKWNLHQNIYPTPDPEWKLLADAYRHVCLLRVLRFPDTFRTPCTEPKIKQSVDSILEACARVPWSSHLYKRFLFPLFMAGADTTSLHQQHYVRWCIAEILRSTKFPQPAVMDILNNVWRERALTEQSLNGPANVPWMEYVSVSLLLSLGSCRPLTRVGRRAQPHCDDNMTICSSDSEDNKCSRVETARHLQAHNGDRPGFHSQLHLASFSSHLLQGNATLQPPPENRLLHCNESTCTGLLPQTPC